MLCSRLQLSPIQGFQCFLRHCSVLGLDCSIFCLLYATILSLQLRVSVVSLSVCYVIALFSASAVSSSICCVTKPYITSSFHCFIIYLLRHCSVLDFDCFIFCLLRHYTNSSKSSLFH